jgi:hypothetical protein
MYWLVAGGGMVVIGQLTLHHKLFLVREQLMTVRLIPSPIRARIN